MRRVNINNQQCPPGFYCITPMVIALILVIVFAAIVIAYKHYKDQDSGTVLKTSSSQGKQQMQSPQQRYLGSQQPIQQPMQVQPSIIVVQQPAVQGAPTVPPPGYPDMNIPSRGQPPPYQQLGILTSTTNNNHILPLYGRQTYWRSSQWNYYTSTEGLNTFMLPIMFNNKRCDGQFGCNEIFEGDIVTVNNQQYRVTLYKNESLVYVPY